MTTTVEIPQELDAELEALVAKNGGDKTQHLSEAIISYLEDQEDVAKAREYLAHPGETTSLDDLKQNLGLDD